MPQLLLHPSSLTPSPLRCPSAPAFAHKPGHEKLLRQFEVERPDAAPVEMQGATGAIRAVLHVGPGGHQLVSSTSDVPGLLVWDLRSGKVERSLETEGAVGSLDVSGPAGKGCGCC